MTLPLNFPIANIGLGKNNFFAFFEQNRCGQKFQCQGEKMYRTIGIFYFLIFTYFFIFYFNCFFSVIVPEVPGCIRFV
jgi:hypothetical protein